MDQSNSCFYLSIFTLFLIIILLLNQYNYIEFFQTYFTSPDPFLPNSNAFGNYYRIGYEQSKNLGWKPSDDWNQLRPEFNVCPDSFKSYPIYFNDCYEE